MSYACSPSALKEMTLQQLLEIREKLLSPDSQAVIGELSADRQHDITLLISQAQINYLKLQRASLEQINHEMNILEDSLRAGMKNLETSMETVTKVETFMKHATGFIRLVDSLFRVLPTSV